MSSHVEVTDADRERFNKSAEDGQCEYCGDKTKVKEEPFGQKPACVQCWCDICFGE